MIGLESIWMAGLDVYIRAPFAELPAWQPNPGRYNGIIQSES